jgi:signal transduction histidine kinase
VVVGFVIAALRGPIDGAVGAWGTALVVYAATRTFFPLRYYEDDPWSLLQLLGELALTVMAVAATGYWNSPFVFTVISAVMAAGFARGFGFALRLAVACALALTIPYCVLANTAKGRNVRLQDSAQWSAELVLVALVAGYARRLFGEAEVRHSLALDRISRLAEANALLSSLHRVAQSLPSSFDLDEILESTVGRVRELVDCQIVAILLGDGDGTPWTVSLAEGVHLPVELPDADLPTAARMAISTASPYGVPSLGGTQGAGLAPASRSGVYAPLRARDQLVGVLALEHSSEGHLGTREARLVEGLMEPAALAIDNARWFARLRTVGAAEERTRIARELHDRIGQSLAYVAFELDRILKGAEGQTVHGDLERLRSDVRSVVGEVRETLYDMRTDVTESRGLVDALDGFLIRVRGRAGVETLFRHEETARLPVPQEREMWRIAQEAISNVERHSRASHLSVQWRCDGTNALLVVTDDGHGFPIGRSGRVDSYGMVGMRERADAIGAVLEFDSQQGRGTTVRCRLENP